MANTNPSPPRRCFQFRLRTLMIGVTLLATVCGYVAWQAKIVRERKAIAQVVEHERSGMIVWCSWVEKDIPTGGLRIENSVEIKPPYPKVSWLRRWLGDDYAVYIQYPASLMSAEEVARLKVAFPEAYIESNAYIEPWSRLSVIRD
jgi:hypothetical protein